MDHITCTQCCTSFAQVLAEVLQQQARLDDPGAAARQEFERSARSDCASCMAHHAKHDDMAPRWHWNLGMSAMGCHMARQRCSGASDSFARRWGSSKQTVHIWPQQIPIQWCLLRRGCVGCLFRKVRGALPVLSEAEIARYRPKQKVTGFLIRAVCSVPVQEGARRAARAERGRDGALPVGTVRRSGRGGARAARVAGRAQPLQVPLQTVVVAPCKLSL